MNSPIFSSVLFSIILLMLPNFTPDLFNITLVLAITAGFFVPVLIRRSVLRPATSFFASNNAVGRKFLSLHGMVFLSIVQIIALLSTIDFLLSRFFSASHNVLLIGVIVIAGLFSVTGRASTIRAVHHLSGILLMSGLFVLLFNRLFLHQPLFSVFNPGTFQSTAADPFISALDANLFITIVSLSIIIFWLMWLEMAELQRKREAEDGFGLLRSFIASGVFLAGVFFVFAQDKQTALYTAVPEFSSVNTAVAFCAVSGLIGLFITTFSSVGIHFSESVYPQFADSVGQEKQMLANKLMTVFSVILAILMIPVVRNAGSAVIEWYIHFLALFSAPIVAGFAVSQLRQQHPFILSVSILIGTFYAAAEYVTHYLFGFEIMVDAENIFVLTAMSGLATVIAFLFMEKASELITVKKLLSRSGNTNVSK